MFHAYVRVGVGDAGLLLCILSAGIWFAHFRLVNGDNARGGQMEQSIMSIECVRSGTVNQTLLH